MTDLAEVVGQEAARRALEVAAAGGHSLLLIGPAGAGKTLLVRCLPGLLPPDTPRPVRVPGLGLAPKGVAREFALAAGGTSILDDLPLRRPATLRALAEALDAAPAQLVATMRPCPCGHAGDHRADCTCTAGVIRRWRARVDVPLAGRFDLVVAVPAVRWESYRAAPASPRRVSPVESRPCGRFRPAAAVSTRRWGRARCRGSAPSTGRAGRCSTPPSSGWVCPPRRSTECCGWRAPSPTWRGRSGSVPPTSPRRSNAGPRGCGGDRPGAGLAMVRVPPVGPRPLAALPESVGAGP